MMKRILCAILTLMLLVSLVPVTAVPASAATYSVTEDAITVLKQLQPFTDECNKRGYIGYGTKCTESGVHGCRYDATNNPTHRMCHSILEKDADIALREALKDTVKAVNNFAGNLGLSQSQFDALVVFSFQNGNAWMSGSGDFKRAVTKGLSGTELLDAMCRFNADPSDDHKRMSEANMYLYGVYSSAVPTYFIKVTLDANGGYFPNYSNTTTSIHKYYDLKDSTTVNVVPVKKDGSKNVTFLGWTTDLAKQPRLTKLTAAHDGDTLYAMWDTSYTGVANSYAFSLNASQLASTKVYGQIGGTSWSSYLSGKVTFDADYIDKDGVRWGRVTKADVYHNAEKKNGKDVFVEYKNWTNTTFGQNSGPFWVKIGKHSEIKETYGGTDKTEDGIEMDVTVTVTNAYVRSRKNASIFSAQNGIYYQGEKLRIIDTEDGDGFLWGQIAESDEDDTPIGWAALMYTNFEEVRDTDKVVKDDEDNWDNSTVVGIAVVDKVSQNNGYVNVRKNPGLNETIVGSHNYNTRVELFDTQYVDGHQWGRGKTGWFSLTYATVQYTANYDKGDQEGTGFTYYEFVGELRNGIRTQIYATIGGYDAGATLLDLDALETKNKIKDENKIKDGKVVGVSNLTLYTTKNSTDANGDPYKQTWGKINVYGTPGWILVTRNDSGERPYYDLHEAKYVVTAETATLRTNPDTGSARKDTLAKGVEFDTAIVVSDGMTLWGKVGINSKVGSQYVDGWVNLSTKYVRRNNGTESDLTEDGNSGDGKTMVATIVGAAEVNVRKTGSLSGDKIGTLKEGGTYVILEDDGDGWYNLDVDVDNNPNTGSWVYEDYLDIHEKGSSTVTTGGTGGVSTGVGVVANTYAGVNFRKTPGTAGAFLGKILPGTTLEIRQTKNLGTAVWGKTTVNNVTGWVSMDYVTMVSYKDYGEGEDIYAGSSSSGNTITAAVPAIYTGSVGTAPANDPLDTSVPASRAIGAATSDPLNITESGRDNTTKKLIVFSETDIGSSRVHELDVGDSVTIHELLTVEEEIVSNASNNNVSDVVTSKRTTYWARVNDGYIKAPGNNVTLHTLDEVVYTLIDHDKLYVYDTAALNNEIYTWTEDGDSYISTKYSLKKGDQVKITEVVIMGNTVRGKIELDPNDYSQAEGWINLSKMGKGAVTVNTAPPATQPTETTPSGPVIGSAGNTGGATGLVQNGGNHLYTGQVVNVGATPLKVRRTASQHAIIETELKNGAALKIYETVISEGMAWGRCDAGWVYLYYVRMTPATGTAIDANVVFNDNTLIYKDSSGGETVGTYQKMAVINIYEKFGDMVRTDLGWVSKANLLHAC